MGLTAEEVSLYATTSNPPQELLRDWSHKSNGTVDDFIKLLSDLERMDIISEINDAIAPPPPPTVSVKEENYPQNVL